jgi:hypothetical protein
VSGRARPANRSTPLFCLIAGCVLVLAAATGNRSLTAVGASRTLPDSGQAPSKATKLLERLEALVVGVDREALMGAGLSLCPVESAQIHARAGGDTQCLFAAPGADGRAVFESVAPGRYPLTGSLSGFADTTVSPLSIGMSDLAGPRAPGSVMLLLNPVCYDC